MAKFRLLGPMEVRAGDRAVPITGPKRQALLGLLLLHARQVVSVNRIIEALWGDDAPSSARTQVQALVLAVRRHIAGWSDATIETHAPGYMLLVDPEQVDLAAFEHQAAEAQRAAAAGRLEEAAEIFRSALALWRGPALDGLDAPFVAAEAARLEEQRLLVLEQRIEVDLALGRHAQLVAELKLLVARHPLRERLRAALMLALHRGGRQAEALEVYRRGREELAEALGLDPSKSLRDLERAILRDEPSLHLNVVPAPAQPKPPGDEGQRVRPRRRLATPPRLALATPALLVAVLVVAATVGPGREWLEVLVPSGNAGPATTTTDTPCTVEARGVTDYRGRAFQSVSHCQEVVGSPLYANPQDRGPLEEVSFMTAAADVAVVCQVRGRPDPGIPHRVSTWWIYAHGDTVSRANHYGYFSSWAFLPANVLAQGGRDRPVPGVPLCRLDLAIPGEPSVASSDYPGDSEWHGRSGQPGRFTFRPVAGTADLAGFVYGFDTSNPDTFVPASGPIEVRLSPPGPGPHALMVRARDTAGNVSPYLAYAFEVGPRPANIAAALDVAPPGCPSGALCVYSRRNYSGSLSVLHDCNRSWATFARDNVDESWFNNGAPDRYARIWQNPDFTGLSYALPPGTGVSDGLNGSDVVVDRGNSNDWPTAPGNPPPPPDACPD